jgi:hypothetical protein
MAERSNKSEKTKSLRHRTWTNILRAWKVKLGKRNKNLKEKWTGGPRPWERKEQEDHEFEKLNCMKRTRSLKKEWTRGLKAWKIELQQKTKNLKEGVKGWRAWKRNEGKN